MLPRPAEYESSLRSQSLGQAQDTMGDQFQELSVKSEYSPEKHFSGFVEVPLRWIQAQGTPAAFPNQDGLSDVKAGFKFAAIATEKNYHTLQLKADFPSGDASKGLGTNHYSIEPSC